MSTNEPEREGGPDAEQPPSQPPEPTPLDVDAAFAAIVAAWGEEPSEFADWPAIEDLGGGRHVREGRPAGDDAADDAREDPRAQPEPPAQAEPVVSVLGPLRSPAGERHGQEDQEPERFVPPEPPPIPRGDAISMLAWAGVIGGPLFLLIATIAWRGAPQMLILGAVGGFIGGFITLVSRMPKHRSDDDDDGAVV